MSGGLVLGLTLAYLAGSFPSAWIAGRLMGVDLGSRGSGNYGATNVYRNLGTVPAVLVLAIDVAKGFLPVRYVPRLLPVEGLDPVLHMVLVALLAVMGHVFSIFLRFRGGKGVGTAFGAYLALTPWATLFAALAWLTVVATVRIVSLASLVAAVVLLIAVVGRDLVGPTASWPLVALTVALVGFVFWTHRSNIGRLRRGEEQPIRSSKGTA